MKNANKIGGSTGDDAPRSNDYVIEGASSEGLDEYRAQVEREAEKARTNAKDREDSLNALRKRLADLAEPSRQYYDAGGGEIREYPVDTSRAERAADDARAELIDAKEAYGKLDTPEKREAEAERRRKEAEEYDKYFTEGLMVVGTSRLEEFDKQWREADDPEAKRAIEEASDEYIKKVVIPAGRAYVDGAMKNDEDGEQNDSSAEEEASKDNIEGEEGDKTITEKAAKFAESIADTDIHSVIGKERVRAQKLLKRINDYNSRSASGDVSASERKQHKKDVEELIRYGYSPSGQNSSIFEDLSDGEWAVRDLITTQLEVGRGRAADYKSIELIMGDIDRKKRSKFKKLLKKRGFSGVPKSWDDERYTSDEMRRVSEMARAFL